MTARLELPLSWNLRSPRHVFAGSMLPLLILGACFTGFFWLVTLPIRLAFRLVTLPIRLAFWLVTLPIRLVFGVGGFALRLLFTPVLLVLAAVALLVGIVAAMVALLTHLLPLLLVGLAAWGIYRLTAARPTAIQRY